MILANTLRQVQSMSWRDLFWNVRAVLGARWFLRSATLVGQRVRLLGWPSISNAGRLVIGDRVRFVSTIVPIELAVEEHALLEIGSQSFINYGTSIAATKHVRIGRRCNIGTYVIMMDNDFHCIEPERREQMPPSAPIILEDNVWLGARVVVLRGVTIGEGSVIGAGSVVVRDIPPRCVAAGVPARVIRKIP